MTIDQVRRDGVIGIVVRAISVMNHNSVDLHLGAYIAAAGFSTGFPLIASIAGSPALQSAGLTLH